MLYLILSILLYILTFPNFSLWPLAFCSLIPFFKAIESSKNYKILFLRGAIWGALINFSLGYSVIFAIIDQYNKSTSFALLFMLAAILLPTSLLSGLYATIYKFIYRNNLFFNLLLVPALWVAIDYLKEIIPILIPWGNINYSITPFNIFIQAADIIGPYGFTFIIVMINSILYDIIKNIHWTFFKKGHKINKYTLMKFTRSIFFNNGKSLLIIIIIFITTIIYGHVKIDKITEHLHPKKLKNSWINSQIIQGNFPPRSRWDDMNFYHRFETYLGMSSRNNLDDNQLIIWPETVLNSPDKFDKYLLKKIIKKIGTDSILISGATRLDSQNNSYNSAYLISGNRRVIVYDKNILLPYSEKSSSGFFLGKFYSAPSEFNQGVTKANLLTKFGNAGISICFELLYSWHIRDSVKYGAQFLINLSNDSWFGKSNEPILHHYAAIWRTIENRRFMLRASNSGISSIISPAGKIIVQSNLFKKEKISGKFIPLNIKSFYSIYGDWVILFSLFIMIIGFGFIVFSDSSCSEQH